MAVAYTASRLSPVLTVHPQPAGWSEQRLWEGSQPGQPNWPKGYSMLYIVMPKKKSLETAVLPKLLLLKTWLSISLLVGGGEGLTAFVSHDVVPFLQSLNCLYPIMRFFSLLLFWFPSAGVRMSKQLGCA